MTTLTGIKNAAYLAQFLGGKIAIKVDKNKYDLWPMLYSICTDRTVTVQATNGDTGTFGWEQCENPYIVLYDSAFTVEIK